MEEIYEGLRWCDGLVLASPVYFGLVSGQLKTMMDRCVCFRPEYDKPLALSGKTGCGIACGGFRNGGQETTLQNMHTFLLQQDMRVINDGQGFSHAGAAVVGEARDDELGLRTVRNMAMNLLASLKVL
jgi:multimeric flavodoxin WrbA